MQEQPYHTINLLGLIAPVAVLEVDHKFRKMRIGETMEMLNCNHETMTMVIRFLPKASFQLLHTKRMRRKLFLYRVMVRKIGDI
jgi:TusA-related sulfurtransferase